MYDVAKAVLHEELATVLARRVGDAYLEENSHQEINAILYFHGKRISELCDGEATMRRLTAADLGSPSFALFQKTFWTTLVGVIGAHRFLGLLDHTSPLDVNPIYLHKDGGFVDVVIDLHIKKEVSQEV
jgi:hypothetical protein